MYTDVAFIRCSGKNVMVVVEILRKSIYTWKTCMRPDVLFIIFTLIYCTISYSQVNAQQQSISIAFIL